MSKYGEKFDKALTRTLKINRGLRIAMIVVFSFLLSVTATYGMAAVILLGPGDGGPGVILLMVALVFLAILLIFIFRPGLRPYEKVINRTIDICRYAEGKEASDKLKKDLDQKLWDKDREGILNITDHYYVLCEELKAKHAATPNPAVIENEGKGEFDGWLIQQIGWALLGLLVSCITFGICFPIAYVWLVQWNYKHTLYDGKRLSFDGRASQIFGKWIIWILLTIVTIGIFALFIPKKLLNWKVSHLHLAGEMPYLGALFRGNAIVYLLVIVSTAILNVITFTLMRPFCTTWKNRYIQNRLVIDGRQMTFDGKVHQMIGRNLLWFLLTIVTLGIYLLFIPIRMKKWVAKHTHIKEGYYQIKVI